MSSADWTMGSSSSQAGIDAGRTVIADVTATGALMYAPRRLRLLVGANALCVRHLDGRLVWLETTDSSSFTAADGSVSTSHPSDEELAMLPRDTAAEAQALVSLPAALAWSAAKLLPGSHAADSQPFELRPADVRTATTDDGRLLQIVIDRETGVILALTGMSLRGTFELNLRSVHVVDSTPDHFAARHL